MSNRVYIGLGSNLGPREEALRRAVELLRHVDMVSVDRLSSLYESAPIGPPQPNFLNAVVEVSCALPPLRLLSVLKHLEVELGRRPSPRWGPRAIDLDVLLYDTRVVAEPQLQIPHLELHRRRFVLEPLCELNPELTHPVLGVPLCELLATVTEQEVARRPWRAGAWDSTRIGEVA
jgi:2-amino-4-hydroxy-6-hydroxymethyldihydropteridine diphosphokinase